MLSTVTRVLSAALCALVLTACGGGQTASSQTRAALQERVGALVSAVNAQDYPTARATLDALRTDVQDARRLGSLADPRAAELIRLADGVQAGLPAAPAPAPAAQAPAVTPSRSGPVVGPVPTQEPAKRKGDTKADGGKGGGDRGRD